MFDGIVELKRLARPSKLPEAMRAHRKELKRLSRFEDNAEIAGIAAAAHEYEHEFDRKARECVKTIALLTERIAHLKRREVRDGMIRRTRDGVVSEALGDGEWPEELKAEITNFIRDPLKSFYTLEHHKALIERMRTYKNRYERFQRTLAVLDDKGWYERKAGVIRQPTTKTKH